MSEDATTHPGGRPTLYDESYPEQARKLCMLLGATDADLARFFDVCESTIDNWKNAHPEFLGAIKAGKEVADANVVDRLYQRAMGYEHDAVKIVADAKTGADHVVPYVERYPPDTTAAIFWLKNRQPARWRDRQQIDLRTEKLHELTDEELAAVANGTPPK